MHGGFGDRENQRSGDTFRARQYHRGDFPTGAAGVVRFPLLHLPILLFDIDDVGVEAEWVLLGPPLDYEACRWSSWRCNLPTDLTEKHCRAEAPCRLARRDRLGGSSPGGVEVPVSQGTGQQTPQTLYPRVQNVIYRLRESAQSMIFRTRSNHSDGRFHLSTCGATLSNLFELCGADFERSELPNTQQFESRDHKWLFDNELQRFNVLGNNPTKPYRCFVAIP